MPRPFVHEPSIIIQSYQNNGLDVRAAARELGIAEKTVCVHLDRAGITRNKVPARRNKNPVPSSFQPHKPITTGTDSETPDALAEALRKHHPEKEQAND